VQLQEKDAIAAVIATKEAFIVVVLRLVNFIRDMKEEKVGINCGTICRAHFATFIFQQLRSQCRKQVNVVVAINILALLYLPFADIEKLWLTDSRHFHFQVTMFC